MLLALLLSVPTFAATPLAAGQSVLLCESAPYAIDAAKQLNSRLVAGKASLTVDTSGGSVLVAAPYSVSAPAVASNDRVNDYACVTVTKQ